jgi:hypothetical protein
MVRAGLLPARTIDISEPEVIRKLDPVFSYAGLPCESRERLLACPGWRERMRTAESRIAWTITFPRRSLTNSSPGYKTWSSTSFDCVTHTMPFLQKITVPGR